jgi:hypothetical protein
VLVTVPHDDPALSMPYLLINAYRINNVNWQSLCGSITALTTLVEREFRV